MSMGQIGARRYRVALYGEQTHYGAGGRPQTEYPFIADAWADMNEREQSLVEEGDRQLTQARATFTLEYAEPLLAARRIHMGSRVYRVLATRREGVLHPTVRFETRRLKDGNTA